MGGHPDEKAQPVRIGTDAEPLSSANGNSIWVKLDGSPAFASLQHAECPYLDEDGTLHIRLEGRLENEGGW
ncbi:hypothetical protein CVT26_007380 [Gymnopilus dilepis]|uniref:Uncharacterized protein n=1 Tax=Gymnopilus dilepis TaxID=231916 RepID=A0A409X0R3_9AGAR|nr:hypothetical protein CVT26_007380 [Gymnopilus dilepis]